MTDIKKHRQIPEFLREKKKSETTGTVEAADSGMEEFESIARAIEDMIEKREEPSFATSPEDADEASLALDGEDGGDGRADIRDEAWAINQILKDDKTAASVETDYTVLDLLVLEALEPLLEDWLSDKMAAMVAPIIREELKNRVIRSSSTTTEMRAEPEERRELKIIDQVEAL